jgi:hypothetical protein
LKPEALCFEVERIGFILLGSMLRPSSSLAALSDLIMPDLILAETGQMKGALLYPHNIECCQAQESRSSSRFAL